VPIWGFISSLMMPGMRQDGAARNPPCIRRKESEKSQKNAGKMIG
jgi:hypothetical protein